MNLENHCEGLSWSEVGLEMLNPVFSATRVHVPGPVGWSKLKQPFYRRVYPPHLVTLSLVFYHGAGYFC